MNKLSIPKKCDPVRVLKRHTQIMENQNYRFPFPCQPASQCHNLYLAAYVQVSGGLIHETGLRVLRQCHRKVGFLPLDRVGSVLSPNSSAPTH